MSHHKITWPARSGEKVVSPSGTKGVDSAAPGDSICSCFLGCDFGLFEPLFSVISSGLVKLTGSVTHQWLQMIIETGREETEKTRLAISKW